ncbi:hypothetical protein [Floccifex sp.]|uniref:hypothetical protein n=1 Tax=Floccifex sp. TaxID=2815810 RepID=UPI003F007492
MKKISKNMIKEAFDHLPMGVCFFDKNGWVTLCNHQMNRLIFDILGKDIQCVEDMKIFFEPNQSVFISNQKVWSFTNTKVFTKTHEEYIQLMACDVTELYQRQMELKQENEKLKEYGKRMRILSRNIQTLIKEEETLNMKIKVHDDIGRSLIVSRQFIQEQKDIREFDLSIWKNAFHLLNQEEQNSWKNVLHQAHSIGIEIKMNGKLPENKILKDCIIKIIKECMNNAVKHAKAKHLYVTIDYFDNQIHCLMTNDGLCVSHPIQMKGGLLSLNNRIQSLKGTMEIKENTYFQLEVTLPLWEENYESSINC